MTVSRRAFLAKLGWAGTGLSVVALGGCATLPALPYRKDPAAEDAAAWLSLRPDGQIQIVMPRAEMGQGISASFRQIVAEETGFPQDRIVPIHPTTDLLPPVRATVGSDSIKDFGLLLAQSAAALAAVLKRAGSVDGKPPAQGWQAYLATARLIEAEGIGRAPTKSFAKGASRTVVGLPFPTDKIEAIVTGNEPLYADDVRLPGMVFACGLRPPRRQAKLTASDEGAAKGVAGYLGLHQLPEGLFVVAETRGALERAAAAVKITWTGGELSQDQIAQAIDVDVALKKGSLEHEVAKVGGSMSAPFDIDLRLDVPMAAHASLEPRTATARLNAEGLLEVWTGSQDVTFVRAVLSRQLSMAINEVVIHGCRIGGGFGGKTICSAELEAARLAIKLKRPVRVQWTRLDEFRSGFHRPPSSHRIRARLGLNGTIAAWNHAFCSGHIIFTSAAMNKALQFATSFSGDPGVARGSASPYAAGQSQIEFSDIRLPVDTGPWRGLGAGPNTWAIETAINELAKYAAIDPLEFRRRNIAPQWPRLNRVLERVGRLSGWSSLDSTPERGYGVACGIYKETSYVAIVAEVVRGDGGVKVTRMWCAHDCGMVVNPDQVRAQIEGNMIWGLGMATREDLAVEDGQIRSTSYADYDLPRFSDVPQMEIELIDSDSSPSGAGETAIVASTAAITGAISAMLGSPPSRLPWRPAAGDGASAP